MGKAAEQQPSTTAHTTTTSCLSWCKPGPRHCRWDKCEACTGCAPEEEETEQVTALQTAKTLCKRWCNERLATTDAAVVCEWTSCSECAVCSSVYADETAALP